MKNLRKTFDLHLKFNDEDWNEISNKIITRSFKKGEVILKNGKIENYISFINKGIIRATRRMCDKERTLEFYFPNEFLCSWPSCLKRDVSLYEYEALDDVELFSISYSNYLKLEKINASINKVIESIILDRINKKNNKITSLIFMSPEERYLELCEKEPELIKTIPLQYLATYIGICPQSLSRIRNRILKEI